jgi:pimeloyl-ACP methyl ester carboxylesterase
MTAERHTEVVAGGADLMLHEWGPEGGRPILHWPGLGMYTGEYLFELGPLIAAAGARVVAIDPPGLGGSLPLPAEGYAVERLAALLPEVLDEIGAGTGVFMGHSWGATVAGEAACLAPERCAGVVLLDGGHVDMSGTLPQGRTLDEHVELARRQVEEFRFPSREAFAEGLRSYFPRLTPGLEAYWQATMVEQDGELVDSAPPEVLGAASYGLWRARPPLAPRLDAAGVPVLLLVGGRSPSAVDLETSLGISLDEFRRRMSAGLEAMRATRRATVEVVPAAGHDLIADAGPEVAAAVRRWLTTLP